MSRRDGGRPSSRGITPDPRRRRAAAAPSSRPATTSSGATRVHHRVPPRADGHRAEQHRLGREQVRDHRDAKRRRGDERARASRAAAERRAADGRVPSGRVAPRRRRPGRRDADVVAIRPRAVRKLQKRTIRTRVPQTIFKAGQSRRRLLAVFLCSVLVFALVVGKVVLLQTSDADALRAAGRAQRTSVTKLQASRGVIFDRNGDELALSVPATTIFADARLVTDPQGTAQALADLLGLSPERQQALVAAFTERKRAFVYVARQIDEGLAAAVLGLHLHGIQGMEEDRRTMPGGEVGKGVIGRTDIDGRGTAGIEKQYDAMLTGTDGEEIRQHDRDGRSLPGTGTTTMAPVPGDDVVLTLDRSVQYTVEQALLARVAAVDARGGTAIVMAAKTGEIIAMASVRRNDETGVIEVTSGNFAAVDAYEPGSVVKAATLAAALNEGTVTPDTGFSVPAAKQYSKGDVFLHDAEPHAEEWWNLRDILTRSSNIGTIETMLTMGDSLRETKEKQYTYLRAFGLGEKSPLDFPGESVGIMKDWKEWEGTEQYTIAYGQGLASTSIQLVSAINVLANGGTYVAPKLVRSTIDSAGAIADEPPSATHRVVGESVAQQMNLMMRDVVCSEAGTGNGAEVPGVTVAGKTGTGLKAQPGGGYLDKDGHRTYYASFVGFFPAEDPQATVLVSIDEPNGNEITRFGGTAAAPVFAEIAPSIMHEMGFTPPNTGGGCPAG